MRQDGASRIRSDELLVRPALAGLGARSLLLAFSLVQPPDSSSSVTVLTVPSLDVALRTDRRSTQTFPLLRLMHLGKRAYLWTVVPRLLWQFRKHRR